MGNVSGSRGLNATPTVRPFTSTLKRFLQPQPAAPMSIDVRQLCDELTEVLVRTSSRGSWQENACFLLHTTDDDWHLVAFNDAIAGELISRLRMMPGFEDDRLLDLIGCPAEQFIVLWRRSSLASGRR
ncbi:MAG: hypothetical protein QOC75_4250 [Pseudonocardiales bacterium]|jgi:hypothetical protein|nr:hypothetical protein [Pseudonocardiales bacterium]